MTAKVLTDSLVLTGESASCSGSAPRSPSGKFASGLVFQVAPVDPLSIAAAVAMEMLIVAVVAERGSRLARLAHRSGGGAED